MHTQSGTKWRGLPTQADELFFPSIEFGGGGLGGQTPLLVKGTPSFVLVFNNVEVICAYGETPYWSLAEEHSRPQHVLNLIENTPLLARLRAFRHDPSLFHFLVCGGDMCAEVIADAYALRQYASEEQASAALARWMMGESDGVSPLQWMRPSG